MNRMGYWFLVVLVASISLFSQIIGTGHAEVGKGSVKVAGRIANMEVIEKYIMKDSYIQFVLISPEGNVNGKTDNDGRMIYESNLEKAKFNPSGEFSFVSDTMSQGQYIIAFQLLKPLGMANSPLFVKKDTKKTAIVTVPDGLSGEMKIDLGEVIIPIH